MKTALWVLFGIAVAGFFLTFMIEAGFERRTTRIQLVRRPPGESSYQTLGAPIDVVDVPTNAVVEPGAEGIAALVDADRINRHGPVLRTDSIRGFAWLARVGCILAAVCLFVGIRLSDRLRLAGSPDPTSD